jgi:hypothetical protein
LITAAQIQFLAHEYSLVTWSDSAVLTDWPTALDAPTIDTQILDRGDALSAVSALVALWGTQRYLFDFDLPLYDSPADIGTLISVTYPDGPLAAGRLGIVVGETIDAKARKITMRGFF